MGNVKNNSNMNFKYDNRNRNNNYKNNYRIYKNEVLSEFSNMYRNRKMPFKSALNIGENMTNSYLESNFIPEYPIAYYSNQELINQCIHSLAEPKQLYSFSSPVGDLEKTIENYEIYECGWSNCNSFTPMSSGSFEALFDKRDNPLCCSIESQKGVCSSFERINSNFYIQNDRKNANCFQSGSQRIDKFSNINSECSEISHLNDELPNIDFEQYYAPFNYFERLANLNMGHIKQK
ncbi:hypothetical protein FG386_002401 [Cryptosporidium ryanae]|uniref:uncharacterized protein n=1 Tax=Cryptosporidium ryanae TaxID=515981 RepID=UPI00351A1202|nr:hypothetical protein FG386_002401 [Cryptosporidium ryanae]